MSQFDAISTIFLELTSPYYEPVIDDHGTEVTFRYRRLGAAFAWRLYQLDDDWWTFDDTDDRNSTRIAVGRYSTLELAQLSLIDVRVGATPNAIRLNQQGTNPAVTVTPDQTPYGVQLNSAAGPVITSKTFAPLAALIYFEGDDGALPGGTAARLRDDRDADRRCVLGGGGDTQATPATRRGRRRGRLVTQFSSATSQARDIHSHWPIRENK